MSVTPPVKIRIIRRGNGQVLAVPPILQVSIGEGFSMLNATHETAQVQFDSAIVTPQNQSIPAGQTRAFGAGDQGGYVEYDAVLSGGTRAEGNSRPGVIIDP